MENKTGETAQNKNNSNDNNGQDLPQTDVGCIGIGGLQYSMSDEELQAFLPDGGFFTCNDLYSVVDPSSGTGVSELDSGNGSWPAQATLIPLNPTEISQMQGNSTGSYIRVIVNNNEATAVASSSPPIKATEIKRSFSSEDLRNQEDSSNSNITQASDSPQSQVEASPQAGVSSQELGAPEGTPVKVRKPRGRKPKNPKEAPATVGDSTTTDYTSNGARGIMGRSAENATATDMMKKPLLTVHHMGDANHANGMNDNGRLEQLFSNRISNVVAAKRPIVTPSYIQRNMALYNQLTAPKKQCDFDIRKLQQDKWMQFPNPSILDNKNGRVAPTPNHMMQNLTGNTPNMQTQNHPQSNATLSGYAALDSTKNMNFRFAQSSDPNVNMNFRFPPSSDSNINVFNPQGNQLGSQSASQGMNPMNVNFENPNLAYSDRNTRYVSASATSRNCQSHNTHHNRLSATALFHEMQSKIDTMYAEQQDLKVKTYYLSKTNKYLLNRSNQMFEEIEALKSHIQLNGGKKCKLSGDDSQTR